MIFVIALSAVNATSFVSEEGEGAREQMTERTVESKRERAREREK